MLCIYVIFIMYSNVLNLIFMKLRIYKEENYIYQIIKYNINMIRKKIKL